jgi:hypothetical protein
MVMDQESAQLISTLFARAEQIPFLTPVLVIISIVTLLIVATLVKWWIPPRQLDLSVRSDSENTRETTQSKAA